MLKSETSTKLLHVLIQNARATAFVEHVDPPPLDLSGTSFVSVQCTMYTSLSASVFAASLAMIPRRLHQRPTHFRLEVAGITA